MSIKIGVKQIIVRGVKNFRVKKIQALKLSQLPAKYEEGEHVFLNDYGRLYHITASHLSQILILREGEKYNEKEFCAALEKCKRCGKILQEINKALKEKNKGWDKEMTFVI